MPGLVVGITGIAELPKDSVICELDASMPGLTLWFPNRPEAGDLARFRGAQRLMVRAPSDAAAVDVDTERCKIGHVGYGGYPFRVWKEAELTVVVEGHVYGRTENALRADIVDLVQRAMRAPDALGIVSDFVRAADGDFLIAAASSERCLVWGDALGRLPIYVHQSAAGLAVARECKFIAGLLGEWSFDRLGLAQHLWLGYPLGSRTLFEGIERAGEGFFLDVRFARPPTAVVRASTYSFRCDAKSDSRGRAACASDVAERILTASRDRANVEHGIPPIVSLSGGHDSRSVLAGVWRARPDCIAATFRRADGGQANDVQMAERVARSLGVRWECFALPEAGVQAEERLVWLKDGLNFTSMAFIVGFLDALVRRWSDRAVLITGDGGDKIFPDLRPVSRPRNFDALVDGLVHDHALMPAAEVEQVLGLQRGALVESLRARLEEYPEHALEQRAVRWKIAERSRKWLCEGEDRNRCFLWQASPCLALHVFEAAMRVPDALKADFRFYAEVQRRLDPALLELPHADTGMSIDSLRFRGYAVARRLALRAAGPSRRSFVRRVRAQGPDPAALRADTLARQEAEPEGSKLLEVVRSQHLRSALERADRRGLHNWRTVMFLDRLWRERIARRAPQLN